MKDVLHHVAARDCGVTALSSHFDPSNPLVVPLLAVAFAVIDVSLLHRASYFNGSVVGLALVLGSPVFPVAPCCMHMSP
jgi:hypothetical protein